MRRRLELGNAVTGPDVGRALAGMRDWRVRMLQLFDDVDLLLTPTTNATAPLRADADMIAVTAELTRFTYAWSLAHLPAASIPSGLDGAGLPTGVQLAAAPWHDALILRARARGAGGDRLAPPTPAGRSPRRPSAS